VEDSYQASAKTRLIVSGRYDHHSLTGGEVSGRATVMQALSAERTLRLSAATAFRSPQLLEEYMYVPVWILFPNPEIKPEGITSYDLEYRLRLAPQTTASIAAYYSQVDDLIQVEQLPGPLQHFGNLGGAQARGVEVEVSHSLSPTLSAFANYTYQSLAGDYVLEYQRPDVISSSPRHKANLGFTLSDPERGLNASLLLNYRDQTPLGEIPPGWFVPVIGPLTCGPYVLVNGYVGWRPPQGPELGLSFFNLANRRHQEYAQGDYIGRRIMGSVRWVF